MDKIDLLKTRREKLVENTKGIRERIFEIVDDQSFVEFDAFSFSKNDFYDEEAYGEGVITGYATLDDTPVYIVAQNVKVLSGGVSDANCKKIVKCLKKAGETGYPVIYLFDSLGVQVGEGVNVLEGIGEVLSLSSDLKGEVPQFSIVLGKLYGSFALLSANADYNFMTANSRVAYASPLVISARSGKNLPDDEVAGIKAGAKNGLTTFDIEDLKNAREIISEILSILPAYSDRVIDTDDDLNRVAENLNGEFCTKCLRKAIFDNGKYLELNKDYCPEVKTVIGRVGGISTASLIFDTVEDGVELTLENVLKIKEFCFYVSSNGLPLITFVNTKGIKADLNTSNSPILKEIMNLVSNLKDCRIISVVDKNAVGLGYSLFLSKAMGVEYSFAYASSKISLFSGDDKAVELGEIKQDKLDKLQERYDEEFSNPVNAAKNGYIDNVIEPKFTRAYLISALQMMVR